MPFIKTIQHSIPRNFCIQFSTPTQDIINAETALQYFNSEASYSLIPGIENTSLLDPQRLLLQILPQTTNTILDITMPFIQINKKKTVVRHLARYIICDQRLIGIKIKQSDSWSKGKVIKQEISKALLNYYKEHGIENYCEQILIGEFIIAFQQFKMAPLFASELCSIFQSNTINTLNNYYNLGCELFSIVNDLTEERKKNAKDSFEILKNYRKESTVFVFSGMHLAISPSQVYKTLSYAFQSSDHIKKINVSCLNQIYIDSFIGDFNRTKKGRKLNFYDDSKMIPSDTQIINCKHLRIRQSFSKINIIEKGKFENQIQIEQENSEAKSKENDIVAYLWNIYVNVIKRKPFVLPCPMNEKDESLMNKLMILSKVANIKITLMVNFLIINPKSKPNRKYEGFNFNLIPLENISTSETEKLHIFFHLYERMALNGIQKDDETLINFERKIVDCSGCISNEFWQVLENKIISEVFQVVDEDQRFVQKFLKRKSPANLQLFYFQMAKYYPRSKLSKEFVANMYELLKKKVKKQFVGTPFQISIISSEYKQISHIFAQSEQKYFFQIVKTQPQGPNNEDGRRLPQQNNSFRKIIQKVAGHVNTQKKSYYSCHICATLFHKKQKFSYGRHCLGCSNFVCYSCFDKKTGECAQSEDVFMQCLICNRKCQCEKCVKKFIKSQDIKQTFAQSFKVSHSRLFNNFGFTSQNFQTNEQKGNLQLINDPQSISSLKHEAELQLHKDQSIIEQQSILIERCWTCQLNNRVDRIINFECSKCKTLKCLSCQRAENTVVSSSHIQRSWVLRESLICNACHLVESREASMESEIMDLKSKLFSLAEDLSNLRKEKEGLSDSNKPAIDSKVVNHTGNLYESYAILQQSHENYEQIIEQNQQEKGAMTPIFNPQTKPKNDIFFQANRAQSLPLKKSNSEQKKRKNSSVSNSSGSKHSERVQQLNKALSNSSRSSRQVKKNQQNLMRSRNSSIESGQYDQNSSSQQHRKQENKRVWKNVNYKFQQFQQNKQNRWGSNRQQNREYDYQDSSRGFRQDNRQNQKQYNRQDIKQDIKRDSRQENRPDNNRARYYKNGFHQQNKQSYSSSGSRQIKRGFKINQNEYNQNKYSSKQGQQRGQRRNRNQDGPFNQPFSNSLDQKVDRDQSSRDQGSKEGYYLGDMHKKSNTYEDDIEY